MNGDLSTSCNLSNCDCDKPKPMTDQRARAFNEHRAKLEQAIDNMEKTSVCLDIFDRALADERRRVWEEAAKMAKEKAERTLSSQHLDIPGYKHGYRGGLLGLADEIRAKAHAGQEG